jgi:hypothetical protein
MSVLNSSQIGAIDISYNSEDNTVTLNGSQMTFESVSDAKTTFWTLNEMKNSLIRYAAFRDKVQHRMESWAIDNDV